MKYNERGEELPDDTPIEAPVAFRRPPSIQELIAMHVRAAMQVERKMGKEDEDDFDDDEETDDVLTPYEIEAYAGEANMEIRKAEETQKVLDKLVKKKDNNNSKGGEHESRVDETLGEAAEKQKVDSGVKGSGKSGASVKGAGSKVAGDDSD